MAIEPQSSRADELFARGRAVFPAGVTAAVRLDPALGRPFYAIRGEGPYIYDQDGNRFVDLNVSFGASILGHGHPTLVARCTEALQKGVLCAFETDEQATVAERVASHLPSVDMIRFTATGTETTWLAVRTARVATGRQKIVKFEGHFHGYNDYLGFSTQPNVANQPEPAKVPDSQGIPPAMAESLIVLPFNDANALRRTLEEQGDQIAAVVTEPISFNAGGLRAKPGYLELMRELTTRHGIVLMFDEILCGYRTGLECMQGYFGITPDLCTLGKAIGAGMPLSAFGGKRWVMEAVSPAGKASHSGTYNAHPVVVAGAAAFFEEAEKPEFYPALLAASDRLWAGLRGIFARHGIRAKVSALGARGSILFGIDEGAEVINYRQALARDPEMMKRFSLAAYRNGIHLQPGWHLGTSSAHTPEVVDDALDRLDSAARALSGR